MELDLSLGHSSPKWICTLMSIIMCYEPKLVELSLFPLISETEHSNGLSLSYENTIIKPPTIGAILPRKYSQKLMVISNSGTISIKPLETLMLLGLQKGS